MNIPTFVTLFVDDADRYTALFRCRLCAYVAQVFISLRAFGVSFYPLSERIDFLTGNEWNYRRLPWPTLHICLSRVR